MTRAFVFVDADGLPLSGGTRPPHRPLPDGAMELPEGISTADVHKMIYAGGVWLPRPQLTIRETKAGVTIPELAGCSVSVTDNGTGAELAVTVSGKTATIVFLPTNCDVTVIASAPLPWRRAEARIVRGTGSAAVVEVEAQANDAEAKQAQLAAVLADMNKEDIIAALVALTGPKA